MAISLAVAFIGSVVAAVGTGVLTARCFRALRCDLVSAAVAVLALTVTLGAMTLGILVGFGPTTFRVMELGGQVVAPLVICLAIAEMAAQTVQARFAARLLLSALAVVAFVILSADQLNPAVAFGKAWPAAASYYETIPNDVLRYGIAPVTALTALTAIGVTAVRLMRHPAWQPAAVATGSASVAALVLAVPAAVTLPSGAVFAAACLIAAGLAWFAATQAGNMRRDLLNGSFAAADDQGWDPQEPWAGHIDQTGDFDAVAAGGEGLYRGNGLFRPEDGDSESGYRQRDDDFGYGRGDLDGPYDDEYADDYEGDRADASYPAEGRGRPVPDEPYAEYDDDPSGVIQAGDHGGPDHLAAAGIPAEDDDARARLFGQIAIYTLVEDRVGEFDRLTEQVVEQVRSMEPDTLVYIVHAVPSAPMQRILYEVYRDRTAYDEHRRQPYVARFELERRPYVLATNVIELGLQQAKVSPLPSISDLLGPSGPGSPGFMPPAPGSQVPAGPGYGLPGYRPSGSSLSGSSLSGSSLSGSGRSRPSPAGASPSGYDELPYAEPEYAGPPPAEARHAEPGYSPSGYSPSGYSPSGSDEPSYDEPGYGEPGYDEARYGEPGDDQAGYDQAAYDQAGYDQAGYDQAGYDRAGYDQAGHHRAGLDEPSAPVGREEGAPRQW